MEEELKSVHAFKSELDLHLVSSKVAVTRP